MRSRVIYLTLAAGLLAAICFVYYRFDPSASGFFPRCPFFAMTGYLCPGCGSQRVVHSLLHLDFSAAFRYNAYLVILLPYAVLAVFAAIFRMRCNYFYRAVNSRASMLSFAFATVLWWVVRNVVGW